MIGMFALSSFDWGLILFIVFFMIAYQVANGPVMWLYSREIATDAAFATCHSASWATILALSLLTYPVMLAVKGQGLFWIFALIALAGAWYTNKNVRETSNLNEKDKKRVYQPDLPLFGNR